MSVNSQSFSARARALNTELTYQDAEAKLPYWARSTNPIVRRHLGLYWRTVPPEIQPFLVILGTWTVLVAIGIVYPPFLGLTMISFLAAIMIIPLTMLLYGHILLTVAVTAADAMQQEMRNNTFNLLRATPMSLSQIFLGKVAAALWRRMDDIVLVAHLAIAFSPPLIFTAYTYIWPFEAGESTILTPIMTLTATVIVLFRVIAEPVMIGVISVFIGVVVPGRTRAITSAVVIGAFYFLILNLASRLPSVRGFEAVDGTIIPPNIPLILLIDFILPVVLPIVISIGLLKLGERIITSDGV